MAGLILGGLGKLGLYRSPIPRLAAKPKSGGMTSPAGPCPEEYASLKSTARHLGGRGGPPGQMDPVDSEDPAYPNAPKTVNVIYDITAEPVGITSPPSSAQGIRLHQNYPNPFTSSATVSYSLTERQYISLDVYDMLGRIVQTLYDGVQEPGTYNTQFHAQGLAAGMYRVELRSALGAKSQLAIIQ